MATYHFRTTNSADLIEKSKAFYKLYGKHTIKAEGTFIVTGNPIGYADGESIHTRENAVEVVALPADNRSKRMTLRNWFFLDYPIRPNEAGEKRELTAEILGETTFIFMTEE